MACNGSTPIHSWNDFPAKCPTDIRELIAYVKLGSTEGVFKRSTDFIIPEAGTWQTNIATYGTIAQCTANRTDDFRTRHVLGGS